MEKQLKKIILILLIFSASLYAQVTNKYLSKELVNSKIPIVDIRTLNEWKETGIIKNSITITSWNETGNIDIKAFLTKLNQKVDTSKPFAIICRTGNRTKALSAFLSEEIGYSIVNIKGGITLAPANKIILVPYK